MIYRGLFTSIDNMRYQIDITTPQGNDIIDITLGASPLIINYEGNKELFKPVKFSGCTITVLTNSPMDDVFNADARSVTATVTDTRTSSVIWVGYVTPNLYTQPYEEYKYLIEIECIDALSTIKYAKYSTANSEVKSLLQIVQKCCKYAQYPYEYIYINQFCNKKLSEMYISEHNWLDEDGDETHVDTVLAHIMTLMKLTILQHGKSLYIIDVEQMDKVYDVYDFSTLESLNTTTLPHRISLCEHSIINGASRSNNEVYNKVKVISNVHNIDTYLPSMTDDKLLFESNDLEPGEDTGGSEWTHHYEWLSHDKWHNKYYDVAYTEVTHPTLLPVKGLMYGAFGKGHRWKTEDPSPTDKQWDTYVVFRASSGTKPSYNIEEDWFIGNPPNFNMTGGDTQIALGTSIRSDLLVDLRTNPIKLGIEHEHITPLSNGYLQFKLKCLFQCLDVPVPNVEHKCHKDYFTVQGMERIDKKSGKWRAPRHYSAIPCIIQFGAKYWDSWENKWVDNEVVSSLRVGVTGDPLWNKWHNITNLNNVMNGTQHLDGYIIPLPSDEVMVGKLTIKLATPRPVAYGMLSWNYSFLKDFEVNYIPKHTSPTGTVSEYDRKNMRTDIVWENIINMNNVSEFEDITLHVSTNVDNRASLGVIMNIIDGKYVLQGKVIKGDNEGYLEEHLVDSLYRHHRKVTKSLELTIKDVVSPFNTYSDMYGDVFGTSSVAIDLYNNRSTLNIIEI